MTLDAALVRDKDGYQGKGLLGVSATSNGSHSMKLRRSDIAGWLSVLALVSVSTVGCANGPAGSAQQGPAGASATGSTPTGPATSASSPAPPGPASPTGLDPRLRRIGPADAGHEVTVRVGDLVEVSPSGHPEGWRVDGYPKAILRLQNTAGPAAGHTFVAVAVGEGPVTLVAGAASFTVRVKVLRDLVVPPPP
jgi:hypothetical protein